MSLPQAGPLTTMLTVALLFWLQGCAEETPELIGPMTGGPHSNTAVSGYMRTGVTFSGR